MAIDLTRIVNCVRDDLKKLYSNDPSAVWDKPFVVIAKKGGETSCIDGGVEDAKALGWLQAKFERKEAEVVVIGRMVAKYGTFIDPTTQQRIILEKALLVTGRDFSNGRTYVVIVPTKEHRDYRSSESMEAGGKIIVPGLKSPDVTKAIKDEMGVTKGWLTSQFGKEQVFDSRKGQRCLLDPLIQGVIDTPATGGI